MTSMSDEQIDRACRVSGMADVAAMRDEIRRLRAEPLRAQVEALRGALGGVEKHLMSMAHMLVSCYYDDEAEVFVGQLGSVLSQGATREEAELEAPDD
jgi:hypothetical protein